MQIPKIILFVIVAILFAAYTIAPERISKAALAFLFMLFLLLAVA